MTENNMEGKGFILLTCLQSSSQELRAGTRGRTLEAGTEAEAMEEWFAPPWFVQSVFLHAQDH